MENAETTKELKRPLLYQLSYRPNGLSVSTQSFLLNC
jgi:hypothetical protein